MPKLSSIVVDQVLTNLSLSFGNGRFIADTLFPVVDVKDNATGIYYKFDRSRERRIKMDLRAPGGTANLVDFGLSQQTYGPITEKSLAQKLPKEHIEAAQKNGNGIIDLRKKATENVHTRLLIGKEYRLATWMANTSNLTQNTTLSGTSQWSDYDNSDPVGDIKTGKETVQAAIGTTPNTLTLGQEVFNDLVDHPDILERIKYSGFGKATTEVLARLFDVEQVIIASALMNSADEGAADNMSYIWGKHAWLTYIEPRPAIESVSLGYTLQMGQQVVDRWYNTAEKSEYVRESVSYEQKAVAVEAAYLVKDAVA